MEYLSTRGGMSSRPFGDVVIGGLAPDGGLVVPADYPMIDSDCLKAWRGLAYGPLAFEILKLYADDIPPEELRQIVERSYTPELFGGSDITPVQEMEPGLHLLRLANGPTLAFKDLALQFLGNLFEYLLERSQGELNILGATSGDTGSAAEHALRGKRRIAVFMLSPESGMSPFQRAQMYSLLETNIFNIAVRGVFDDCQDMVKALAGDAEFKRQHRLGAVNSINWARLAAQLVYYFKAYLTVTQSEDEQVTFAVPSGNFGNVCAGHIARQMGLPIRHLVVATNENDVLDEFLRTGVYRPRPAPDVHRTSSPSMDISKASNLERFVYDLQGRDADLTRKLFADLSSNGHIDLSGTEAFQRISAFGFLSGRSHHSDRLRTIKQAHERYGLVLDPHTADGLTVAERYREPGVPLVCLETAQPCKFEKTIMEALGKPPPRPTEFAELENRTQRYETIDANPQALKDYIVEHTAG
jgi:threonine synthase